jgi:hypothetical protein
LFISGFLYCRGSVRVALAEPLGQMESHWPSALFNFPAPLSAFMQEADRLIGCLERAVYAAMLDIRQPFFDLTINNRLRRERDFAEFDAGFEIVADPEACLLSDYGRQGHLPLGLELYEWHWREGY